LRLESTRDQAEVDFVVNRVTEVYPVEVKSQRNKLAKVPRALKVFCKKNTRSTRLLLSVVFRKVKLVMESTPQILIPGGS
jgi:protein tyrosine phosphatase (PTP) superfamily phosphohydrolase (DUF442 family)